MALVRARTSAKAAHPQALVIMELEAKTAYSLLCRTMLLVLLLLSRTLP